GHYDLLLTHWLSLHPACRSRRICFLFLFFFSDTATTEIYTLSLHDALPICKEVRCLRFAVSSKLKMVTLIPELRVSTEEARRNRSEEHTSELQSQSNLVCRLLLEKKKQNIAEERSSVVHRISPTLHAFSTCC